MTTLLKYSICRLLMVISLILCSTILSHSQQPPAGDINHNIKKQDEYIKYNPDFVNMKADRVARLRVLQSKVREKEAAGLPTVCSRQILWEIGASITQTSDFKFIDKRFDDLDSSLVHPERETLALKQDTLEGNWGRCFTEWFCKLNEFCDEIGREENKNSALKIQPHFLDLVNSPEKLTNYLMAISVSDIAKTGKDNLLEFNLSLSNLMRLILRDRPKGYPWDPRLKETLRDLIFNHFRNLETGWWGESYVRNDRIQFVDDLSATFHIVTYLEGDVPDLNKVISTTLAVRDLNYPVGWLWNGVYWNHNNMDVAALFKAGWRYAKKDQKRAISFEIQKMLNWCLSESLQTDGSFRPHIADGSLEESVYYGVSFLGRIGYFDKSDRFWTKQTFKDSDSVRTKIIGYILKHNETGGSGGSYYESALTDYLHYKPLHVAR
jgi:hypothetical protein